MSTPLKKRNLLIGKTVMKTAFVLFLILGGLTLAWPSFAQFEGTQENVNAVSEAAGISGQSTDLVTIIGRLINIALGFVGVLLLIMLLFSGYQYMTAGGDADKVQKATTRIRNAIIGLVIIMLSFAIVNFIMGWLTGGGAGGIFQPSGYQWGTQTGFGQWGNSGSLGDGVIEYHYPERDQTGVPRNTAIAISFKEPIDPASFIEGWTEANPGGTDLNSDLIKIHPQDAASQDLQSTDARVTVTDDKMTVVIKPNEFLGNVSAPMWYEVVLEGGADGVKNASGTALFTGGFDTGYTWSFEVSTEVDTAPPRIVSYIPYAPGTYARNIVVQINFNEPMLPVSVSGFYQAQNQSVNFQNITVSHDVAGSKELVEGEYRISNGYRTVEFITTDACGTNSCLVTMYCLPADASIEVITKAATLSAVPPQAAEAGAYGFDGAVDMAANSLDGNGNGIAEGPAPGGGVGNDSHGYAFATNNDILLDPPSISSIDPGVLEGQVPVNQPIEVSFDTVLLGYTVNANSVRIIRSGPGEAQLEDDTWYYYSALEHLNANGSSTAFGEEPVFSRVILKHRPFLPSEPAPGWDALNLYAPEVTHGIMNVYQNCFNPATSDLDGDGAVNSGGSSNPNLCNEVPFSDACENHPQWKP